MGITNCRFKRERVGRASERSEHRSLRKKQRLFGELVWASQVVRSVRKKDKSARGRVEVATNKATRVLWNNKQAGGLFPGRSGMRYDRLLSLG